MNRRRPGRIVPLVALVGGLVAAALGAPSYGSSGPDTGAELLRDARDAATRYDFTGQVIVEWRADGRRRSARVPVREADGVLRVGKHRAVLGVGQRRLMDRGDGWQRLWGAGRAGVMHMVAPDRKYVLRVGPGPEIDGRATVLVEARRDGTARERFAVDDRTGLLLRREQLDGRGRVERTVGFTEISEPVRAGHIAPHRVPSGSGDPPVAISKSATATVPRRLGLGFTLSGSYRDDDGSVQHFYSDGLYTASLFEQSGDLDPRDLPDDATSTSFGKRRVLSYEMPSGTVAVWSDADHVYTLVSDAPKHEVTAMLQDLPDGSGDDPTHEVTRFVLAPFRW